MAFDWADFLSVSRHLRSGTVDEAAYRSAISRAYYAAYGTARSKLTAEGEYPPEKGDAHVAVWRSFRDKADRVRFRIGEEGNRLRNSRRSADYDETYTASSGDVDLAIQRASTILSLIGGLR